MADCSDVVHCDNEKDLGSDDSTELRRLKQYHYKMENEGCDEKTDTKYEYIIVGGGIAGVSCAEMLATIDPESNVLLISESPVIKAVTNFRKITKRLEDFDVIERPMFELNAQCPSVTVTTARMKQLHSDKKIIVTDKLQYRYEKLCLCTGATPKLIAENNPYVLGIRDTETVKMFQKRLNTAKRIMVVGNGGIATEIVYEIEDCEIIWAIKDDSITSTFIDPGAAQFFLPHLVEDKKPAGNTVKRMKYKLDEETSSNCDGSRGSALGPDWHSGLEMHGAVQKCRNICVEYKVEVEKLLTPEEYHEMDENAMNQDNWPLYVKLTNNKVFGCDFVVSATGVIPNIHPFMNTNHFTISAEGGVCVDDHMCTNIKDVYAAGDVCTATWDWASLWQQMRLWSQARQMGGYAAKCMVADSNKEEIYLDFCFEMFAHATRFFNYKVVLLGKYNAQGMGKDHDLLVRVTKGKEYVKAVMKNGIMYGAILIGETDLEETFENLILNQMDLSSFGEDLLDPNIDIEDYFD